MVFLCMFTSGLVCFFPGISIKISLCKLWAGVAACQPQYDFWMSSPPGALHQGHLERSAGTHHGYLGEGGWLGILDEGVLYSSSISSSRLTGSRYHSFIFLQYIYIMYIVFFFFLNSSIWFLVVAINTGNDSCHSLSSLR